MDDFLSGVIRNRQDDRLAQGPVVRRVPGEGVVGPQLHPVGAARGTPVVDQRPAGRVYRAVGAEREAPEFARAADVIVVVVGHVERPIVGGDDQPIRPVHLVRDELGVVSELKWDNLQEIMMNTMLVALWGADFPLTVIGDTVTLPVTIPIEVNRSFRDYYFPDAQKGKQARNAESESLAAPVPPDSGQK